MAYCAIEVNNTVLSMELYCSLEQDIRTHTNDFIVPLMKIFFFFFRSLIYFYRGEGREKERERNNNVWFPLAHPLMGTWPTTQACALTGNRTGDPLVCRLALSPLSHTSQGH